MSSSLVCQFLLVGQFVQMTIKSVFFGIGLHLFCRFRLTLTWTKTIQKTWYHDQDFSGYCEKWVKNGGENCLLVDKQLEAMSFLIPESSGPSSSWGSAFFSFCFSCFGFFLEDSGIFFGKQKKITVQHSWFSTEIVDDNSEKKMLVDDNSEKKNVG